MYHALTINRRRLRHIGAALLVAWALLAALGGTAAAGGPGMAARQPAAEQQIYVPMANKADPFANWVSLGQPAGSAAVNYLFIGQQCANEQPTTVLAGTNQGLYRYTGAGWERFTGLSAGIQVSHVLSPAAGSYYVASYDQGLWHSADSGISWVREALPGNDARIYWLAANDQYLYAAGSKGLFRRPAGGGGWGQIRSGAFYSVAVAGSTVYAAMIGASKDTLLISGDAGATWPISRQIPGAVNFVQTLDAGTGAPQLLIGAVRGGLYTLDGANNIVPFSQGVGQTVYGLWRDAQGRVYAALEAPGGLQRFAAAGGTSELDLSALPGGGALTSASLYTVNGTNACAILAVGSQSGQIWMRRAP